MMLMDLIEVKERLEIHEDVVVENISEADTSIRSGCLVWLRRKRPESATYIEYYNQPFIIGIRKSTH